MAFDYRYRSASRDASIFAPDDDDDFSETTIEWSNLIFLPFHPVFKLVVLFAVIIKCILGPVQSVYPIVYCWDVMDRNEYLICIKYFYWYGCDPIYMIDTFLHIVHRQVTDKALRREFLPKSAFLIVVDFLALIPFFRITSDNDCPPVLLWPNLLAFTEFFLIYRVMEYFSLATTHSFWNLVTGFTILTMCTINCFSCFWLLLTKYGLCSICKDDNHYDWRNNFFNKHNEADQSLTTYVYGVIYIYGYLTNKHLDSANPFTLLECVIALVLIIFGYLLILFIVLPKLFAESILTLRRIATGYLHVKRLIEETKRRNPLPNAHIYVENFLTVIWRKRSGISYIPDVITELPRYLRLEIKQDLSWPLFYHSPTLRKRTIPFKRYLCDYVTQEFILPGEKFFAGPHSHSNLYYIKSGVVQILSGDEGITPMLSVGSGTILGDISFFVPPFHRKVIIKCLTYCDVLILTRRDYIRALHKHPEDRRQVLNLTKDRLKHAKRLYNCKLNVKGLDRAEDEGIAWLKRRWWEISHYLKLWNAKVHKDHAKCELPPEESIYHCAKYIGQLVLCTSAQLQTKSLFTNVSFPWILVPNSPFIVMWRKIVMVTVFLVLIMYPPNITRREIPTWFRFIQVWTDLIYVADIGVSLLTAVTLGESSAANFAYVMFTRCKTLHFNLDLLSTIWIEYFFIVIGKPEFFNLAQFNRLIKVYMLFFGSYIHWDVKRNPLVSVFLRVSLANFCFWYISAYIIYILDNHVQSVTTGYFFGDKHCKYLNKKGQCDPGSENVLSVAVSFLVESFIFSNIGTNSLTDMYISGPFTVVYYFVNIYCKSVFISTVYLRYLDVTNYQNFVSNLRRYYKHYKIHNDLLRRLERYLLCHWKYYQGQDVLHPNILKNERYEIYWKVQGEVAEKIIGESKAFERADPGLIRDLACAAKFLVLPKKSTIFLFGVHCQNVTWIVQGHVKCEYHNEDGELMKEFYGAGSMLSDSSVFMGNASLRTYAAYTDCEIVYIRRRDFFQIVKQYHNEWSYMSRCISEFGPIFEEMLDSYAKKHRDYQRGLRERIFHARRSTSVKKSIGNIELRPTRTMAVQYDFWIYPKSNFMKFWLPFRAIVATVSIVSAVLQGGSGAIYRRYFIMVGAFCNSVTWIDIVLKLFLAYYDSRGILISDKKKCAVKYLTGGFFMDVIGGLPRIPLLKILLSQEVPDDVSLMMNTSFKYAHIHIVIGYFNYISDMPSINHTYVVIAKWFVIATLTLLGTSHYLISYCVQESFNKYGDLTDLVYLNTCWIPTFFILENKTMAEKLHLLLECNSKNGYTEFDEILMRPPRNYILPNNKRVLRIGPRMGEKAVNIDKNISSSSKKRRFVTGYSVTMLVLNSRGNTLFEHGVRQLRYFLKSERVDKKLIERATAHFTYWWRRTRGINVHHLTNERIGMVLRQDLNYYFYKRTFLALETLLHAGEYIVRQLASNTTQIYLMPDEEIIREMDLTSWVFVVHRGKVIISENGEKLNSLTKGSIFGQLTGMKPRPVRISAKSEGYTDVLQLHIQQFQQIIDDDVRDKIARNPQSSNDYMAVKKVYTDNAYRSIQYILRGRKTILLPYMQTPMEAHHGNIYTRWLYVAWLVQPFMTAVLVLALKTVKPYTITKLYYALAVLDCIHLTNFVLEFFTVQIVVVRKQCVQRTLSYRRLKNIDFYIDVITLALPQLTFLTGNLNYQFIRLLRLGYLYNFHRHFCTSFKSKTAPIILKSVILFLLLHGATSNWISLACRSKEFPSDIFRPAIPSRDNLTIDYTEWVLPDERVGGCAKFHDFPEVGSSFVVPLNWYNDYIVALVYIMFLFTHSTVYPVTALTIEQIYFKLGLSVLMYVINIWLTSVIIGFVTTKFRELYQYDYGVNNLILYLSHCGLSPALVESVRNYTRQLWQRQRGTWLPELAQSAPMCLRQDMLTALYMHHLDTPPLLRELPVYFKRQLAARLKRIVLFPGKCIVQEGDIYPCIYFIHEGEVEKFYFDKSGDNKFLSLLGTNGFFGSMAGLFPNFAFQFSYYSRTVVDLVYLRLCDWQDLLDGYPDIKRNLYISATKFRENYGRI